MSPFSALPEMTTAFAMRLSKISVIFTLPVWTALEAGLTRGSWRFDDLIDIQFPTHRHPLFALDVEVNTRIEGSYDTSFRKRAIINRSA